MGFGLCEDSADVQENTFDRDTTDETEETKTDDDKLIKLISCQNFDGSFKLGSALAQLLDTTLDDIKQGNNITNSCRPNSSIFIVLYCSRREGFVPWTSLGDSRVPGVPDDRLSWSAGHMDVGSQESWELDPFVWQINWWRNGMHKRSPGLRQSEITFVRIYLFRLWPQHWKFWLFLVRHSSSNIFSVRYTIQYYSVILLILLRTLCYINLLCLNLLCSRKFTFFRVVVGIHKQS